MFVIFSPFWWCYTILYPHIPWISHDKWWNWENMQPSYDPHMIFLYGYRCSISHSIPIDVGCMFPCSMVLYVPKFLKFKGIPNPNMHPLGTTIYGNPKKSQDIPSGELTLQWKITMLFMGKSTIISMAIFHGYVKLPEGRESYTTVFSH